MDESLAELEAELAKITKTMDVPDYRRHNPKWLARHMGTRNAQHPQYERAQQIAEELLKHGIASF